jgi:lysophospholipase
MRLIQLPENPIPDGAVIAEVTTEDGLKLRAARWAASAGTRKGTVCLLPGRAETIEKYFEVIGDLRRRGFAVATLDWRGQGGSPRQLKDATRGHVDDFAEYDLDLRAFMREVVLPDCPPPYFVLGHSIGCLVALRAAQTGRTRFTRMVLASPLLAFAAGPLPVPRFLLKPVSGFAAALGLGDFKVPGHAPYSLTATPFPGNRLTSDPVRFQRNLAVVRATEPAPVGPPTFSWLYAAMSAMQAMRDPDFAPTIQVPILMVAAGQDEIASVRAIEMLSRELRAGAHVMIPGARHELMMERNALRELFWAAFDAFVPGSQFT